MELGNNLMSRLVERSGRVNLAKRPNQKLFPENQIHGNHTWYCGGRDVVAAARRGGGGGRDAEAELGRDGRIVEKDAALVGRERELDRRIRFSGDDSGLIRVCLCNGKDV